MSPPGKLCISHLSCPGKGNTQCHRLSMECEILIKELLIIPIVSSMTCVESNNCGANSAAYPNSLSACAMAWPGAIVRSFARPPL
jgi:hypothetical protein